MTKDQVISPNEKEGNRIRSVPPVDIKQEVDTLIMMENLNKVKDLDVKDLQYKEWLIKKLRLFYPDVMNRLMGEEKK